MTSWKPLAQATSQNICWMTVIEILRTLTGASSLRLWEPQPPWVVNFTSWGFKTGTRTHSWRATTSKNVCRHVSAHSEKWSGLLCPTVTWLAWCIKFFCYFGIFLKYREITSALYLPIIDDTCIMLKKKNAKEKPHHLNTQKSNPSLCEGQRKALASPKALKLNESVYATCYCRTADYSRRWSPIR